MLQLWQFQLVRIIPLIIILAYAAYSDYKSCQVSNKLWLYAPVGLALMIAEVYSFTPTLFSLNLAIAGGVSLAAFAAWWFFDLMEAKKKLPFTLFGAADSKALILLSLCMPLSPVFAVYVGIFPLAAFLLGGIAAGLKFIFSRRRNQQVRFLPYLLIGTMLALV